MKKFQAGTETKIKVITILVILVLGAVSTVVSEQIAIAKKKTNEMASSIKKKNSMSAKSIQTSSSEDPFTTLALESLSACNLASNELTCTEETFNNCGSVDQTSEGFRVFCTRETGFEAEIICADNPESTETTCEIVRETDVFCNDDHDSDDTIFAICFVDDEGSPFTTGSCEFSGFGTFKYACETPGGDPFNLECLENLNNNEGDTCFFSEPPSPPPSPPGGGGQGGSGGTGNGTGGGGGGGGTGGSVGNITATGINGNVFLSSGNSSATADATNFNILNTSSNSVSGNDNDNTNVITLNNNQNSSNNN